MQIVHRLSRGTASVSELGEPFEMSLRAVLKHVQILEEAGLIRTHKTGRVRHCELEQRQIDAAAAVDRAGAAALGTPARPARTVRDRRRRAMTTQRPCDSNASSTRRPKQCSARGSTREALEVWYRDGDDFVARVTDFDFRVGGRYRVEFGPVGQAPYVEWGVYREIDPPRRIVMSESLDGVDHPWADTTVTVDLHDQGGKTLLVLTHAGFPSQELRDLAGSGWPGFLDRIEQLVAHE